MRGIIKPNGEYAVHYRAGVQFDRDGREFLVDDAAAAAAASSPHAKRGIHHVGTGKFDGVIERKEAKEFVIIDEPEKPLVLSRGAYDYLKLESGKALVFEPIGGAITGADALEKAAAAERQAEHHRARAQDLEVMVSDLSAENTQHRERIAELEQQLGAANEEIGNLRAKGKK